MKSKNAKEFIEHKAQIGWDVQNYIKAVELAENEMRERAIAAFKKTCLMNELFDFCSAFNCAGCTRERKFIELLDKTE